MNPIIIIKMQKFLVQTFEYFLDMIFPIECLGCGKNREELPARDRWICPECLLKVNFRSEQVCPFCEQESEGGKTHYICRDRIFLDGLWAACYYDAFIEKAVHNFKFNFISNISFTLSSMMIKSILDTPEFGDMQDLIFSEKSKDEEVGIYIDEEKNQKAETILVPVPLHRKRYNWRGFNQSILLSKIIADKFGLPVWDNILRRIKNTKPQSMTKNEEERRKNISCAFFCPQLQELKHKNVILVDDICTTSATLNECAKELKKAGAKSVWGLVVARR